MKRAKLREFDLSLIDKDIADAYRNFGIEKYEANRPLLAHICQKLNTLVGMINNLEVKVSSSDNSQKQCCNSKDDV